MISIFLCIIAGTLTGYLLRSYPLIKYTGTLLGIVIMLLLFFLGVSVGINRQVVDNFPAIGGDAFILTIGGTLGSMLSALLIYRKYFKNREEE